MPNEEEKKILKALKGSGARRAKGKTLLKSVAISDGTWIRIRTTKGTFSKTHLNLNAPQSNKFLLKREYIPYGSTIPLRRT